MTHVLAEIGSNRVLTAVIWGIPVAVVAVFLLWAVPRRIGVVQFGGTLVIIGAVVVGMWAAFAAKPPPQTNSQPAPANGIQFPAFPLPSSSPVPSGSPSAAPGPSASPSATCSPSGSTLMITAPVGASVSGFAETCLAVAAGKDFSVTFVNNDPGVAHTWSLFKDSSATTLLGGASGASASITGPAQTAYQLKALPAGTYFFRCDIHPTVMTGTLVVG